MCDKRLARHLSSPLLRPPLYHSLPQELRKHLETGRPLPLPRRVATLVYRGKAPVLADGLLWDDVLFKRQAQEGPEVVPLFELPNSVPSTRLDQRLQVGSME